jgi:abortive infection bacteriophage resistance protein
MFDKNATTIFQQIDILKTRGLTVKDDAFAIHQLVNISYYRLGEYWYVMQEDKANHTSLKINLHQG